VNLPTQLKRYWSPVKVGGTAAVVAVGLCLYAFRFGAPLERLSFDLPFAVRTKIAAPEIVLVYLDEESARQLHQSFNQPWDRALHTKLLDRLTKDGAKLVYYDIVFAAEGPDEQTDRALAEAMRKNGHVILSAEFQDSREGDVYSARTYPPFPLFRTAAAGWGVALFHIDPDYGVRELRNGTPDILSASWVAAEKMGAEVTKNPGQRLNPRWLNYVGPSGTLTTVSFHQALYENGVPPDFFRNKIVLIGTNFAIGGPGVRRDQFANPYSRWGLLFSPGLEVHATEFVNLTHGNWLRRLGPRAEIIWLFFCGLSLGVIGNYFNPRLGTIIAISFALIVSVVSITAVYHAHLWWNWLVPVLVQTPLAIAWSSGSQYFNEARRRAALRQAFAYYLSPQMADKISELDFDLKPGGKVVEASLLFTDCKGFTTVSEELNDPQKLSELLIEYFTQTSRCVLDNGGTIIKYIGDSVMAAWGVPLEDPDHPRRAVKAAWELREASKLIVRGRVLTTRVGVSTGKVLAGNLGSPYRFDYTCIGDTTNLASRLEGMNKMLGTDVLISETTKQRLGDEFVTRLTGHFAVAGKSHSIAVHEVLGLSSTSDGDFAWLTSFNEAFAAVRDGSFEDAKKLFRKTIWDRGGEDGPSQFYLKKISDLEKADRLREWTGVVRLDEK
jgi:adenylate cyclase